MIDKLTVKLPVVNPTLDEYIEHNRLKLTVCLINFEVKDTKFVWKKNGETDSTTSTLSLLLNCRVISGCRIYLGSIYDGLLVEAEILLESNFLPVSLEEQLKAMQSLETVFFLSANDFDINHEKGSLAMYDPKITLTNMSAEQYDDQYDKYLVLDDVNPFAL